ncbi:hypothetical protein D3C81_2290300 [compost metagenome]
MYQLPEGMDLEEFDHEMVEPFPAGIGFFYDEDSLRSMIDRVNQELKDIRDLLK